jgi:hypothetical protein
MVTPPAAGSPSFWKRMNRPLSTPADHDIDAQLKVLPCKSEPAPVARRRTRLGPIETGHLDLDNYLKMRRITHKLRRYGGPVLALVGVLVAAFLVCYGITRA